MFFADAPGSPAGVGWPNVCIALSLVVGDAVASWFLGLGIASSLLIAAGRCVASPDARRRMFGSDSYAFRRCIVQLSLMGIVLDAVFKAENPWAVAAMSLAMVLLGPSTSLFRPLMLLLLIGCPCHVSVQVPTRLRSLGASGALKDWSDLPPHWPCFQLQANSLPFSSVHLEPCLPSLFRRPHCHFWVELRNRAPSVLVASVVHPDLVRFHPFRAGLDLHLTFPTAGE